MLKALSEKKFSKTDRHVNAALYTIVIISEPFQGLEELVDFLKELGYDVFSFNDLEAALQRKIFITQADLVIFNLSHTSKHTPHELHRPFIAIDKVKKDVPVLALGDKEFYDRMIFEKWFGNFCNSQGTFPVYSRLDDYRKMLDEILWRANISKIFISELVNVMHKCLGNTVIEEEINVKCLHALPGGAVFEYRVDFRACSKQSIVMMISEHLKECLFGAGFGPLEDWIMKEDYAKYTHLYFGKLICVELVFTKKLFAVQFYCAD